MASTLVQRPRPGQAPALENLLGRRTTIDVARPVHAEPGAMTQELWWNERSGLMRTVYRQDGGRRRLGRAAVPGRRRLALLHSTVALHPVPAAPGSADRRSRRLPARRHRARSADDRVVWIESSYQPRRTASRPSAATRSPTTRSRTGRSRCGRSSAGGRFKGRTFSYYALKLLPDLPREATSRSSSRTAAPTATRRRSTPSRATASRGRPDGARDDAALARPLVPRAPAALGRGRARRGSGAARRGRCCGRRASRASTTAASRVKEFGARAAVSVRAGPAGGDGRLRVVGSPSLVTGAGLGQPSGRSSASIERRRSRWPRRCGRSTASARAGAAPRTGP